MLQDLVIQRGAPIPLNTTGKENTYIGYQAGEKNTTGNYNTFSGRAAGRMNTIGNYNNFFGRLAGYNNTTGIANVFMGHASGYNNISGRNNTYIGHNSGYQGTTGSENTFVGGDSGQKNTTGRYNTYVGRVAGFTNVTGSRNTILGRAAGYKNTSGSGNVFIGADAGYNELGSNRLYIQNNGSVEPLLYGKFDTKQLGINTNVIPAGYAFAVKGKIISEELKVQLTEAWPDYVFATDYELQTLEEVERFILENGHLPDIPSAQIVEENGILLGQMNAKLLEKIEELTLYTIQQKKELKVSKTAVQELEEKNAGLEDRLAKLEAIVETLYKN